MSTDYGPNLTHEFAKKIANIGGPGTKQQGCTIL